MNNKMNIDKERDFNYYSVFGNVEETGLVFQFMDDIVTSVPDKEDNHNVPLENDFEESSCVEAPLPRIEVPRTYQKVIEVHEMNEAEINIANKIRYILDLIFKGFFREDNVRLWCAGISYGFIAYDLIEQNYFASLVMFAYSLLYTDVKKGIKTLVDYFSGRKREELESHLKRYGVLDYTNELINSGDVKMYIKYRRV